MRKIESVWNYFFNFTEGLSQKSFIKHYFLDLLFFVTLLMLSLVVINYNVPLDFGEENLNVIEALITTFIFYFDTLLCLLLLILNRISIVLRRLKHLKLRRVYLLLSLIPIVSLIFDLFLMLAPLEGVVGQEDREDKDDTYEQKSVKEHFIMA